MPHLGPSDQDQRVWQVQVHVELQIHQVVDTHSAMVRDQLQVETLSSPELEGDDPEQLAVDSPIAKDVPLPLRETDETLEMAVS